VTSNDIYTFTPKYLMVFDHDITLESLATILLHTQNIIHEWRGGARCADRVTFFYKIVIIII